MAEERGFEGALADIQQTRVNIQGTKDADILTDKRPTREDIDVPRSPTTRLIRGSLAHALNYLRNDPMYREDRAAVDRFRAEGQVLARAADRLDVQFHKNGREVETQLENGATQPIHVTELDLNPPKEGEVDKRIPRIMIGGALSTSEQNAGLSMALALQGEKVLVMTYPGQMREQSGARGILERIANPAKKDVDAFTQVIQNLGYPQVNLIGHSMGGRYALEIAGKGALKNKVEVHDVVSLAPTGFEKRNLKAVGDGFAAEDKVSHVDPEQFVGMALQGNEDAYRKSGIDLEGSLKDKATGLLSFLGAGRAAASQSINSSVISNHVLPNITGDLEIWTGENDKIVQEGAVQNVVREAVDRNPREASRLSYYVIEGATHNTFFINGLGYTRAREAEQEARHDAQVGIPHIGKRISVDSLERSGAEWILKQMQQKSTSSAE